MILLYIEGDICKLYIRSLDIVFFGDSINQLAMKALLRVYTISGLD